MYAVGNDEQKSGGSGIFGLNKGNLIKFELNTNAGKDGAEGLALDIAIKLESGKEYLIREFPITKAFTKDGKEVSNPKHPDFKKAVENFNNKITHILKAVGVTVEDMKSALVGTTDFAGFVNACMSLLPKNFQEKQLDVFLNYQWSIKGDNERTYLEVPKTVKHGKFLVPSMEDVEWQKVVINAEEGEAVIGEDVVKVELQKSSLVFVYGEHTYNVAKDTALCYINEGMVHPFTRTNWFMTSNYGNSINLNADDDASESEGSW